ncbi:MAG: HEAT repeat domain-containing protein [Ignavibacteriales bacterium]|nr:HEAT repeat domain-containing protein [Ignavibacteriales bacterium]
MTTLRTLSVPVVLMLLMGITEASSQKLSPDEREILWHQDQRSLADSVLYRYLKHKDSKIRARTLLTFASIQDTASIPAIVPLLSDRFSDVRAAAAFALGQIGSPSTENDLAERLRQETQGKVILRLLESLGKSGSVKTYDDVIAFGLPKKLSGLRADQCMSLARYAIRNIKSERGVWFCFDALEETDPQIRWTALFALWRIAPRGAIDVEVSNREAKLAALASDRSADVRMHFATLLGKLRSPEAMELLKAIQKNDARKGRGNWRVQVNIVRALAGHAGRDESAIDGLLELLDVANNHVKMAVLTSVAGLSRETVRKYAGGEKLRKKLQQLAAPSKRTSEPVRGEALVTLAKHYPADFTYANLLADLKASNLLRSKAIEAVCQIPSTANLLMVLDRLEDDSTRVAMAAWDFIRQLLAPRSLRVFRKDTVTSSLGTTLFRKAKVSLLREDIAITNLVANALGDSSIYSLLREDNVHERALEELMLAYGKLFSPNDVEAMQAVLQTLGKIGDERTLPLLEQAVLDPDRTVGLAAATAFEKITGTDVSHQVVPATRPLYTDYDWKTLGAIPLNLKAEIKTTRGSLVVRFHKEGAPFTVLSFYKLIRKKFFDGLTFHRVVPNFVVQGGDPRGDGWGGPNYALRSEFPLLNYGRGQVGVASAGKDTEGCQFFITHSPQPHLDGRYTHFASVESGLDIVDLIQPGDVILSIRIKR